MSDESLPPPSPPPPVLPTPLPNQDADHLRMLAIGHYVVAGIGALFACFPIFHVVLGIMMATNPDFMQGPKAGPPMPPFIGYVFAGVGILCILTGWVAAILTVISGRSLAKRRRRIFTFVWAGVLCMFTPFGTVLGIFTFIVLSRESVQRLYLAEANSPAQRNGATG